MSATRTTKTTNARTLLWPVLLHPTGLQFCAHARPVGSQSSESIITSAPCDFRLEKSFAAEQHGTLLLNTTGLAEQTKVNYSEYKYMSLRSVFTLARGTTSTLPVFTSRQIKHPQSSFLCPLLTGGPQTAVSPGDYLKGPGAHLRLTWKRKANVRPEHIIIIIIILIIIIITQRASTKAHPLDGYATHAHTHTSRQHTPRNTLNN